MTGSEKFSCCRSIGPALTTQIDDALLSHMLVTEYYDGPIGGFFACPICNVVYHFVILDWSHDHSVRIISLAQLPPDAFERLVGFFGEWPKRKHWIPKMLSRANEKELERIEPFVASLASQAEEPSIVLAWNVFTNHVLAARRPDTSVSSYLTALLATPQHQRRDWFAFLELPRN